MAAMMARTNDCLKVHRKDVESEDLVANFVIPVFFVLPLGISKVPSDLEHCCTGSYLLQTFKIYDSFLYY